jgi:hypothetical protein
MMMLQTALTKSGSKEGASLEIHYESGHDIALPNQPQSTTVLKGPEEPNMVLGSLSTPVTVQPRTDPEQDKTVDEKSGEKRKRAETEHMGPNADGVRDDLQPTSPRFQGTSSKRRKIVPAELVQNDD